MVKSCVIYCFDDFIVTLLTFKNEILLIRYAGRFDCGCTYTLKAKLLDKNERVLVESELISKTVSQWHGRDWCKVRKMIFVNYNLKIITR